MVIVAVNYGEDSVGGDDDNRAIVLNKVGDN